MTTLCDEWLEANEAKDPPAHIMIRRNGEGPKDAKCKTCKHLYGKQYAKRYYKCGLFGHKGPRSDWKVNRPACARYEEGEAKVYICG